jgi:hypothetical protein
MEMPIFNIEYILFAFGIIVVCLLAWIVRLEIKLHRFLKGSTGKTLENSIMTIKDTTDKQIVINKEIAKEIDRLDARIGKTLRGFNTTRFNAFKGTGSGGNQSYAVALLNEEGDGVILSSLYGRDRFSAFAKPIQRGECPFELSDEEKHSLSKAKDHLESV